MGTIERVQSRMARVGALSVLTALTFAQADNAAADQRSELRYQVAWGNMTLAEAKVNYVLGEDRYEIEGSGQSQGTLAFFFPWKGSARTVGVTTPDGYRVSRHDSEGSYKDKTRRTTVLWNPREPLPKLTAEPQPDLSEVTPVPESETTDTADPFTVLLRTLNKLEQGDRCEAEARVWDGRRLYDLKIEHIGRAELMPDRPLGLQRISDRLQLDLYADRRISPGVRVEGPAGRDPPDHLGRASRQRKAGPGAHRAFCTDRKVRRTPLRRVKPTIRARIKSA